LKKKNIKKLIIHVYSEDVDKEIMEKIKKPDLLNFFNELIMNNKKHLEVHAICKNHLEENTKEK